MFLKAQAYAGPEFDVPFDIAQALADCMEDAVSHLTTFNAFCFVLS